MAIMIPLAHHPSAAGLIFAAPVLLIAVALLVLAIRDRRRDDGE